MDHRWAVLSSSRRSRNPRFLVSWRALFFLPSRSGRFLCYVGSLLGTQLFCPRLPAVPSINLSCMRLANCRCFRHQVLLRGCGQWYRCGRDRVARPSEQENLDPQPQRNRCRQEDVSKGEPSRRQTSLHSRSSDLTSELQSSVRSDEVVIATEQLQVLIVCIVKTAPPTKSRTYAPLEFRAEDGETPPLCSTLLSSSSHLASVPFGRCVGAAPTWCWRTSLCGSK